MNNDGSGEIYKHRETDGNLWLETSLRVAVLVAGEDGVTSISTPTGEMAMREGQTEAHRGLYWEDLNTEGQAKKTRLFYPNYFNTIRIGLQRDNLYSNLIGNRGTVLSLLGQRKEAEMHFAEAEEFMPKAGAV